ncbi:MocR-like pyridoxine biosynthesis transcription factor PdxR [Paraburkholderia silvatlantica]|uniref:GntR family transcriptional regulator n=1 Tax=Paraburkholderia silvatlantica TaxID=321895 RepID=A0A2U1ABD6_9BURK|nr:PLP-dependent aminotransferase family protein [Paraburkholderia silvatlantica]MBB2930234.1 GntR family transcriptional regulator/MocR family aminotransferase [Paraburkholderia silvatlantica]PVY32063.1 GntR family transcriptional regulator [Paraburkholderia silvatlantica]PXW37683.1 GntR family transcriptional regulator [Paraburkholderia silvatlantica]PYE25504.1 GntR family transcriptional regulator [Paraburkholderia silvatlantica]TDQ97853.1 GntR family transcriptional regulator [Paraburkhold
MELHVTVSGRRDLAGQIYRQLRDSIVDGRLAGGTRLPSTRDLALQLGVSRKTTLDVFERLLAEGYLNSRRGSGTFVAETLERLPAREHGHPNPQIRAATAAIAIARAGGAPRAARATPWWQAQAEVLHGSLPRLDTRLACDFAGGVTDKSRFPFDIWRRCINDALRVQARGYGMYRDPAGEEKLRLAVSRYLAFNRAVQGNWQDVIVTQGAQQALDLLARVTLTPGDVVVVEDPGYPPARDVFAALGAKVVPVPVDRDGLVVARLPKAARLVYVTPSHQFPLGMPLSLERRVALLEWAQASGALVIEDDYDCEYRFEGRSMEPLKSLDNAGLVAYVGTFSKTMFPELRVGYMVPPAALAAPLARARQIGDAHGCVLTQTALADFMLNGHFARHLRRMHQTYAQRRDVLLAHLCGPLAPWLEPVTPNTAGLHLAARLVAPLDAAAVAQAARRASIGLHPLAPFHLEAPVQSGFLFGYGGVDAERIDAALTSLATLLRTL